MINWFSFILGAGTLLLAEFLLVTVVFGCVVVRMVKGEQKQTHPLFEGD